MKIFNVKKYDGVSFSLVGKKELQSFFINFCKRNGFNRNFFVESFSFSAREFFFYSHSRQIECVKFFDGERYFYNGTESVWVNGLFQIRDQKGFVVDYDELSKSIGNALSKTKKTRRRLKTDCSTASYRTSIKKKYKACRNESKREHGDFLTSVELGVKIRARHFKKVSLVKRYCMEDFTWKRKEERCWKSQRKGKRWER